MKLNEDDAADLTWLSALIGYNKNPHQCIMDSARAFGLRSPAEVSKALIKCGKLAEAQKCVDVFRTAGEVAKKNDSLVGGHLPLFSAHCDRRARVQEMFGVPDTLHSQPGMAIPYTFFGRCEDSSWYLTFNTRAYDSGWKRVALMKGHPVHSLADAKLLGWPTR